MIASIASASLLRCVALCALLFVGACAHLGERPNPLVGTAWDVANQRPLSLDEVMRRAAGARYVLVGEVHDNAQQHRFEPELLRRMIASGARPALAMEQFDIEHQQAIDVALAQPRVDAEAVADAGKLDRDGWEWPLYQPLVAMAVEAKLSVVAVNLSRPAARRIASEGLESLGGARRSALGLDAVWTPERDSVMHHQIAEGHCGQAPVALLPRLVLAQRTRDATIADALLARAPESGVAILGASHAWRDLGVPLYLRHRDPAGEVLSIGFVETDPEHDSPEDYDDARLTPGHYDIVWFTATQERVDPCAGLVLRSER